MRKQWAADLELQAGMAAIGTAQAARLPVVFGVVSNSTHEGWFATSGGSQPWLWRLASSIRLSTRSRTDRLAATNSVVSFAQRSPLVPSTHAHAMLRCQIESLESGSASWEARARHCICWPSNGVALPCSEVCSSSAAHGSPASALFAFHFQGIDMDGAISRGLASLLFMN